MRTKWHLSLLVLLTILVGGIASQREVASAQAKPAAPRFQVDPSWPLEMPNHWIMGAVTGVFVDAKQHVWVTHLPETLTEEELYAEQKPPMGTCCKAGAAVLEFDEKGKLVQGWGEGSMTDFADWPREPHGIFVDHNDFVWVGSYDRHRVMKFTREGKLCSRSASSTRPAAAPTPSCSAGPRASGSIPRPTKRSSPTAIATAA